MIVRTSSASTACRDPIDDKSPARSADQACSSKPLRSEPSKFFAPIIRTTRPEFSNRRPPPTATSIRPQPDDSTRRALPIPRQHLALPLVNSLSAPVAITSSRALRQRCRPIKRAMKGHLQRPRELNQTSHHVNIDPPIVPQDPEHHTRPTNQPSPAPTINPKKRAYWIASEIRLSIHSVSGQNESLALADIPAFTGAHTS